MKPEERKGAATPKEVQEESQRSALEKAAQSVESALTANDNLGKEAEALLNKVNDPNSYEGKGGDPRAVGGENQ